MPKWSESFRRSLETELRKKGWTNERLAESVGISGGMVGRYLKGTSIPSLDIAADIAEAVAVPLSDLIGATAGPRPIPKIAQILDMLERALLLKATCQDAHTIHEALSKSPFSTDIPLDNP